MDEVFFTEDGDVLVMEYVSLEKYHEMVAQYEHRVAELRKKHAAAAPGEKEGIERQLKAAEKDLQELRGSAHHYTGAGSTASAPAKHGYWPEGYHH